MMKYLYIIRHAKSEWEDLSLPDIVRPLNERGRQSIVVLAEFLKKQKIKPDFILSSPATRALHTAIGVSALLGYPNKDIVTDSAIYFLGKEGMLDAISRVGSKKNRIFIFSHEPSCSELIYQLTGDAVMKFPTTAIFGICFEMENWENIMDSKGKKILFTYPKQIQQANEQ